MAPGFRSRFTQRLAFDDHNDAELSEILHGMLKALQYRVEPATEHVMASQLALERVSGAFGIDVDQRRGFPPGAVADFSAVAAVVVHVGR